MNEKTAILCADDDPELLAGLKSQLRLALGGSYLVETAEDGREALDLFSDLLRDGYEIPLVIADYIMPGLKGDELLRRVHALAPGTRTVLLTGHATLEAMGYVVRYADLYRYMAKPLDMDDLHLTVREALASYHQSMRLARFHASLEQQIAQRTLELNDKNRVLEREIEERNRAESGLRESQRAMATLLGNLPGMAYRCLNEPNWTMQFVSEGCARLTGYPPEALLGNAQIGFGDLIHPDDREPVWEAVQEALAADRPFRIQYRIRTQEGAEKWVWEQGQGVSGGAAVEGLVIDITERVAMEQALRAARDQADRASRAKTEFLANMNHEIRTPMNAVLGYASLLQEGEQSPTSRRFLDAIQSAGKTLLRLIDDILDLSRIESGKLELEHRPADLRAILGDLEQMFARQAADKGLVLSCTWDPGLPPLLVLDEIRVRQILLNLIGNAIKFTPEGWVRVNAAMQQCDGGGVSLALSVADTGVGIPEGQQDRIFLSFTQRRGQRHAEYGGAGLGLAIASKLAQLMGGTLEVESRPELGSTFTFRLPRVEVRDDWPEGRAGRSEGLKPSPSFAGRTVLVVDDVESNRQLMVDLLTPYGVNPLVAENGRQAVDLARAQRPDLVLMDINMPVLNGIDARRLLKQDARTSDIPVLAVSASLVGDEVHRMEGLFDGVLLKPVTRGRLDEFLGRLLRPREPEAPPAPDGEIHALPPSLWDAWRRLSPYSSINEIERFGESLVAHAERGGGAALGTWGTRLTEEAARFDLEAIERTLEALARLLERGEGDPVGAAVEPPAEGA